MYSKAAYIMFVYPHIYSLWCLPPSAEKLPPPPFQTFPLYLFELTPYTSAFFTALSFMCVLSYLFSTFQVAYLSHSNPWSYSDTGNS